MATAATPAATGAAIRHSFIFTFAFGFGWLSRRDAGQLSPAAATIADIIFIFRHAWLSILRQIFRLRRFSRFLLQLVTDFITLAPLSDIDTLSALVRYYAISPPAAELHYAMTRWPPPG